MKRLFLPVFLTLVLFVAVVHPAAAQTLTLLHKFQTGHDVASIAFSPNGQTLAAASGTSVFLWNTAFGRLTRRFSHDKAATAVVFSPDGKTLAVGKSGGTIRIWNVATASKLSMLKMSHPLSEVTGDAITISALAYTPDGSTLVTGTDDGVGSPGTIVLWNAATGRQKALLRGVRFGVSALAISPNGKLLAAALGFDDGESYDGEVILWGLQNNHQLWAMKGEKVPVNTVNFSSTGETVISGDETSFIRFWNVQTGQMRGKLNNREIISLALSPDGKTLAAGDYDGVISLWNWQKSKLLEQRHIAKDIIRSVAFSSDGNLLATGSDGGLVTLWRVH